MSKLIECRDSFVIRSPWMIVMILSLYWVQPAVGQDFSRQLSGSESGQALLELKPRILTDDVRRHFSDGSFLPIADREEEALQVINTLIRIKGRNPVLLGAAGVGKTAIAEKIAQMIVQRQIPTGSVYSSEIAKAEIIQLQASSLGGLARKPADSAQKLVQIIANIERTTQKPIILFVDEMHIVDIDIWDSLKPALDAGGGNGLRLIGATTEREYQLAFGKDEALLRRFQPIGVSELSVQRTVEVIRASWQQVIEARYGVNLSSDLIEFVAQHYKQVLPDVARPDGPIKVLVDLAIVAHGENRTQVVVDDFYEFVQTKTKLPANPRDLESINQFIKTKTAELKGFVLNQERLIDDLMGRFRSLLLSSGEKPESAVLLGPTGIGKTFLAEQFAEVVLGGKGRFFTIDGAAYADRSVSLSGLLGPRPGTFGYKDTIGELIAFMSNPGAGKYGGVLLIDEIEKMHPDTAKELLMSLLDRGEVMSGGGKRFRVPYLFVIATSNHGLNQIFPPGYEHWSDAEVSRRVESFDSPALKKLFVEPSRADDSYRLPRELVNRFSLFSLGNPHNLESAIMVAKNGIESRAQRFLERNGIQIEVDDSVVQFITEQIFSKEDGLRDLTRALDTFFSELTKVATTKNIRVSLNKVGARRNWTFQLSGEDGSIELQSHSFHGSRSLLTSDDLREVQSLKERVQERIVGQEELLEKSIAAIRNWLLLPNGKPLSISVVGSTGTGKTETAKALAFELFGSENKAQILALGEMRRIEDWTKIFGANPQYVKADQEGLFEKALVQIRDGGILVLDEILNSSKSEVLQEGLLKFYNLSEEGFWVSPNTGIKYDLSKIIFWYNGNLLQEHYYGVSSDDMRMAIYQRLRPEGVVRQELRKAGVTEAFLGRQQVVVHTKPQTDEDKEAISQIMLAKVLKEIALKYVGLEVKLPDSLVKTMSDSFFSSDQGARSLRNKFDSVVKGLIVEAILEAGVSEDNAAEFEFELKLIDQRSRRAYAIPNLTESFFAQIVVSKKETPGIVLTTLTTDLLDREDDREKPHHSELIKVAFHEVGHAILNDDKMTGRKLRHLTIQAGSSGDESRYLGYAAYDPVRTRISGLAEMRARLISLAGGRAAQEVAGFTADVGWRGDYGKMVSIIARHYIKAGLSEELWGSRFDEKTGEVLGTEEQKEIFAKLVRDEIQAALEKARQQLSQDIGLVRFLVSQLLKKMSLSGDEFRVLVKYFNAERLSSAEAHLLESSFKRIDSSRPALRPRYDQAQCLDLMSSGAK